MLYRSQKLKAIVGMVFVCSACIFCEEQSKFDKWKIAVSTPSDSLKVLRFFYNNPHWPLFEESVKIAEKNITDNIPDSVIIPWFKRYKPRTSDGLLTYIERLLKTSPKEAMQYIKQTWIYQNLSSGFSKEYREKFEKYLTPVEDAKKAKFLMKKLNLDQLRSLKDITSKSISDYIKKYFQNKQKVPKKQEIRDIDEKCGIIQNHIDKKRDLEAAKILAISSEGEETHEEVFYRQRRHIAYNVLRSGNAKLAYDVMKLYKIKANPDERTAKAEWLLGYIAFRYLDKPALALQHFQKAFENSKKTIRLSKNAFWLAEVHYSLGNIINAIEWYKKGEVYFSTFYGYLSRERLKALNTSDFTSDEGSQTRNQIFANRELVQVLNDLEDHSMSKYFYKQLIDEIEDPYEEIMLLDLAKESDEIEALISESEKKQHYLINDKIYKTLGFDDLQHVFKISNDPCFVSLVHAMIQKESNFKQNAKSQAGAIGLMQIMPTTAKYEAKKIKFYIGGDSLYDRERNIIIGSFIINRLLRKYNNNMIYAIAAYNCGEGNISKFQKSIRKLKNLPLIDIVELIPIKETRLYTKHVLRGFFHYLEKFKASECYNCQNILKR